MQTLKKWVKTSNNTFTFWDSDKEIGTMEIDLGTLKREATIKFEGQIIEIKKTGFWRNVLELSDQTGQLIGKVYHEKWYANSSILEYENKKFKLLARNNPLAEWAIQENNEDLLAYGLGTQNGKACIKITTGSIKADYLFDFILWYFFLPIAFEQMSEDFSILLLTA